MLSESTSESASESASESVTAHNPMCGCRTVGQCVRHSVCHRLGGNCNNAKFIYDTLVSIPPDMHLLLWLLCVRALCHIGDDSRRSGAEAFLCARLVRHEPRDY